MQICSYCALGLWGVVRDASYVHSVELICHIVTYLTGEFDNITWLGERKSLAPGKAMKS